MVIFAHRFSSFIADLTLFGTIIQNNEVEKTNPESFFLLLYNLKGKITITRRSFNKTSALNLKKTSKFSHNVYAGNVSFSVLCPCHYILTYLKH